MTDGKSTPQLRDEWLRGREVPDPKSSRDSHPRERQGNSGFRFLPCCPIPATSRFFLPSASLLHTYRKTRGNTSNDWIILSTFLFRFQNDFKTIIHLTEAMNLLFVGCLPCTTLCQIFAERCGMLVGLATHGYAKPRGNAGGCLAGRRRCNGNDLYRTTYTV